MMTAHMVQTELPHQRYHAGRSEVLRAQVSRVNLTCHFLQQHGFCSDVLLEPERARVYMTELARPTS